MDVKQIYELTNTIFSEALGETATLQEDLSNITDIGTAYENVLGRNYTDKYVGSLINQIGKIIFDTRPYSSTAPKIFRDSFEFGSIVEKIHMELPTAQENASWELEDGHSYDPWEFKKPICTAKFWNSKTTFEIQVSITERQVKQSFRSAGELSSFINMIYDAVDKAMAIRMDSLVMRVIDNLIGGTMYKENYGEGLTYDVSTSFKAINLLHEYNVTTYGDTTASYLTPAEALKSKEFLRFACYRIGQTKDRMAHLSRLFNVGGYERFTDTAHLSTIYHTDFANAIGAYAKADTFNEGFISLPEGEKVAFWQGSGLGYDFSDTSKIDAVINVPKSDGTIESVEVEYSGIIGVMFDKDACGISNTDNRVTSIYNPKAEFTNNWYKADASYFNDFNENCVVFYIAKGDYSE